MCKTQKNEYKHTDHYNYIELISLEKIYGQIFFEFVDIVQIN